MVPFHGSCPRCHHFHINKSLPLPLNISEHVRCLCDRCEHQMFGFGRTSTQTTLASVESTSSPQRSNRNSSNLRPSSRPICISPPDDEGQTIHLPSPGNLAPQPTLSTIDESHTPAGRSRSTSNLPSPHDASVRPEGTTLGSSAGEQENSIVEEQPVSELTEVPQPADGRRRPFSLRNAWHRAVHSVGHGSGARKWRLPRIIRNSTIFSRRKTTGPVAPSSPLPQVRGVEPSDLVYHRGASAVEATSGSALTQISSQAQTRDPASFQGDFSPDPTERVMDSPTRETDDPPRGSESTTRTSRELEVVVDTSQPGEPDDMSSSSISARQQMTERSARRIKRDRIEARRREKTLQRDNAIRPLCECHPGCPCREVNRASGSDVASEAQRTPNSNVEPPDYPLPRLWAPASAPALEHGMASAPGMMGQPQQISARDTQLSGIGDLFAFSHHRPNPSVLTLANRLSQATTIHNGSSSSLSPIPHRGQSLSQQLGPSVRSRSPEVIQSHGLRTSSTRSEVDSDSEDFRHSSEETIADGSSMHTGITAPADISDAQDRPQPLVQGRSTSLSIQTTNIPTVNGSSAPESQTATPRPISNNELSEGLTTSPPLEPAAISSALRDINPTQ